MNRRDARAADDVDELTLSPLSSGGAADDRPRGLPVGVEPSTSRARGRGARIVGLACGIYLVALIAAWALLSVAGDRMWVTVPMLYGPQWLWLVPMSPLALLWWMTKTRRWASACTLALAALVALHMTGLRLGLHAGAASPGPADVRLRVLTCNVGLRAYTDQALADLVRAERPDVVALVEATPEHAAALRRLDGWQVRFEKNLLVASPHPIRQRRLWRDEHGWRNQVGHFELDVPGAARPLNVFCVHLLTPRDELRPFARRTLADFNAAAEHRARRDRESAHARAIVDAVDGPAVILGDLNLSERSLTFRRDWRGWTDAFASVGRGFGFTFGGYGGASDWWGVRIDYVLSRGAIAPLACQVLGDVGSDHRPVLAELRWSPDG